MSVPEMWVPCSPCSGVLRDTDDSQLMRLPLGSTLQMLVDAEASAHIGAEKHERTIQRNRARDKVRIPRGRFERGIFHTVSTPAIGGDRGAGASIPGEHPLVDAVSSSHLLATLLHKLRFRRSAH